jgi:hypothetical protein
MSPVLLHARVGAEHVLLVVACTACPAVQRLETRLSREKYWDQTAYNEEIFFLSHDNYKSPGVRHRILCCGCVQIQSCQVVEWEISTLCHDNCGCNVCGQQLCFVAFVRQRDPCP